MLRLLLFACAAVILQWSAPASAQELKWFYCFAPDAKKGVTYVSDVHPIGPVSERSSYGQEFGIYLDARGTGRPADVYCVMRATMQEINRGRRDLRVSCAECAAAKVFQDVAWRRRSEGIEQILRSPDVSPPAARLDPEVVTMNNAEKPIVGAYVLGRRDDIDIVHTENVERAGVLNRLKADQKGGKWDTVLADERCPGWIGVAFASNGVERRYFAVVGGEDEGAARREALRNADAFAAREDAGWLTGTLTAFLNDPGEPAADYSRGVVDGLMDEVKVGISDPCAKPSDFRGSPGVRG